MRPVRRLLMPLLVAAGVLGVAAPAVAAWNVAASSGEAFAAATAVEPPAGIAATVTISSVTLTWSAPATGPAPSGYTVLRTSPTAAPICVNVAATTCTDSGLTPTTTYGYSLVSTLGPWQSVAATASATTLTPTPMAFLVTAPATATAGTSFTVTIQARQADGTNDPTYTGPHALTFSGPGTVGTSSPVYPASAVFDSGGLATVTVTLFKAESVTVTVADSDPQRTGISGIIAVVPGPATRLRWTSDAAGLSDACPSGSVVVGPNGQRSWYVGLLDQFGNRAVQGASAATVTITRTGGNGNPPNPGTLTVNAGANPAVTSGTTVVKLKKKLPTNTTYRASSPGLTQATCTLTVT